MKLPAIVEALVKAQNNGDSAAYADCFSETAIVLDEGKSHKGKAEIKRWIEKANKQYRTVMRPISYESGTQTLKAEISGTFPGSPLVLDYSLGLGGDLIHSLRIV